jgi:hypothetical protein
MRTLILGVALVAALVLPSADAARATDGATTATGVSREFNPAISVNTLLLGRVADQSTDTAVNGVDLQEAEIQFTSIVDPYWKANLVFAVHPEHGHDHAEEEEGAEEHAHGGYTGHVEVAYVDGTNLPWNLALRLGKDYLPFGKHVPLHTHQFAFVDAPVAVRTFLGDHSLTEVGARAARTLPVAWYSDLTVYAVDGKSEIFAGDSRDLAYGARWSNLFDLSVESTLELGGSWLHGPLGPGYLLTEEHAEDVLMGDLDVWGADVTFKWVSAGASRGPALTLTGEVILPRPEQGAQDPLGWYAHAQYRFARNWWLGLGAGAMDRDLPEHDHEEEHAEEGEHHHDHGALWMWEEVREYKANLTWTPSEFSALRLEAARYDDQQGDADEWLFSLQVNFTIGSHPAHLY